MRSHKKSWKLGGYEAGMLGSKKTGQREKGQNVRKREFWNIEPFEKCSILLKAKKGENFNRRNTSSISRIEI
jgi:hypothetical protein